MKPHDPLRKSDWLRFQVRADKRVLEGFVQSLSADGDALRIGAAPDSLDAPSYSFKDIIVLKKQSLGAPV